jgi:carbonic anhydrase
MSATKTRLLCCAAVLLFPLAARADDTPTAVDAIKRLKDGNARFAADKPSNRDVGKARRTELAKGQQPFAVVLACADSRVTPELIFDQGLGDIFVLRVAGNISEPAVLGSIEYAVEHLHNPLIVVLGHESCGAVKAALDGAKFEGNLGWLVERIQAGNDLPKEPKAALAAGIKHNTVRQAQLLSEQSKVVQEFVRGKRVQIAAGVYSLETGKVDWLDVPESKEKPEEPKPDKKGASIKVIVPAADAKLWFNESATNKTGLEREFASPTLEAGKTYTYRVKASWIDKGAETVHEKKIQFKPGENVVVDFRK